MNRNSLIITIGIRRLHSLIGAVEPRCRTFANRLHSPEAGTMEPAKKIKTIKIFAFLVCLFGFWFLSFGFPQSASAGWTAGKFGSAISFDGINDYVKSNSSLPAASAFSYSLWFKSSDGAYAANEYLFSQGTNSPSVYIGATNGKINLMADNALKITSNKTFLDANWHHLEITADGTSLKLYLDGILESSTAYTGSSAAGLLYVASNATPGSYFGGIIDDVKVYAYARTQDEIFVDYNAGKAAHLGKDNQRDDGLVGYWNMEEGKGQTVFDRSGNANNGTLGASTSPAKDDPVFTSGYSSAGSGGTALKFDGVDDYVGLSYINGVVTNGTYSMEAWINPKATVGLILEISNASANRNGINFNNNRITAGYYNGTSYYNIQYATVPTLNTWYHVVFVNNGGIRNLYINGVATGSLLTAWGLDATNKIGGNTNSGYFNGTIDEVRIYNRALSADEIRQHYNQKKPVLEMKFDEGSGTSTKDESFRNNDGTLYSGATVCSNPPTANCPAWVQGKYGSGIHLDGVDDYVSAGDVNF